MTDFLGSLKADLLDRRILPIVVLLGVALVGALAYAVLGGGSSASTPAPLAAPVSPLSTAASASSITVTQAPTATGQPVAETTSGSVHRSVGASRNPFAPLPGAKAASSSTASATSAGSGSSSSSTSGASSKTSGASAESTAGSGGATPTPESKPAPSKPKKQTVYTLAVLFGAVPAGSPSPSPSLTPYEHLKRQQPLPSSTQPLVVFRGVTAGGKSASFTLVGEAILRGGATCLPNASQCQAIDLKPGQVEELEYVPLEGAAVIYQLQVVSIDASKASASAARRVFRAESKAGLQFLRAAGLSALPGLRYSADKGVLVFTGHPASVARAHMAAWGASLRG
jgi:hypothetical protein